jgi:orotidine-5'-phosphate decarboxylase
MLIVTPGIQLAGTTVTDQARIATPYLAHKSGATHIVIGRSITQSSKPREAFNAVLSGMQAQSAA